MPELYSEKKSGKTKTHKNGQNGKEKMHKILSEKEGDKMRSVRFKLEEKKLQKPRQVC